MTESQRKNLEIALDVLMHLNGSFDPDDWCGEVSMLDKSQEGIDALISALKEDNEVSFYKTAPAPVLEKKGLFVDLIAQHPGLAEELAHRDIQRDELIQALKDARRELAYGAGHWHRAVWRAYDEY